ncbi:MAG: TolC family protein [Candidatus Latescibacteria bacterium]|nr:TolC family protein [Candidatus Latescibacterota bacterium]
MKNLIKVSIFTITVLMVLNIKGTPALEVTRLTVDNAVDIAMKRSYRIKQIELGIARTRYWLKAERAGLKSKVFMNLRAPEFNAVSDYKWNSTLQIDEIIRQNTRRWQMDISVRQPVILLGYPTNGYLSLNNKIYRYYQKEDIEEDVDYYNRFFIKFEQPILRPNELKNDIENAELSVEREELDYIRDIVNLSNSISFDFYNLFGLVYRNTIYSHYVEDLENILKIAQTVALEDTTRKIEEIQANLELTNAREMQLKNFNRLRQRMQNMKLRLRMDVQDSILVKHDIVLNPIEIDANQALQYGYTMRPHLRLQYIEKRRREIRLNNAKGWDAFHLNLEMTLGLEKNEDRYQAIWEEYDNSYSVSINAYIPIWDWGRRKAWVGAEKVNVKRADLNIEENRNSLKSSIVNTITNLKDYQQRALNLKESVTMAQEICDMSIQQYKENRISLQGVLQVINRQRNTGINFLDAYLGYRRSLQQLKSLTYYDYETGESLLDRYRPES